MTNIAMGCHGIDGPNRNRWFTWVYLLNMVIFHGYVSHNQMVVITGYFYGIIYTFYKWGLFCTYNWYDVKGPVTVGVYLMNMR